MIQYSNPVSLLIVIGGFYYIYNGQKGLKIKKNFTIYLWIMKILFVIGLIMCICFLIYLFVIACIAETNSNSPRNEELLVLKLKFKT